MTSIMKFFFLIIALPASPLAQISWVWQNPLPQGLSLSGIHAFNATTAIAVGGSSTVMKTTDAGAAVGESGVVLHTTNDGAAWPMDSSGTQHF